MMAGRGYEVTGYERLDEIAYKFYGDPAMWRVIARANNIAEPLRLQPGQVLWIPTAGGRRQP